MQDIIKNIFNDTKTIIMNNVTVFILLNALWGLYYVNDLSCILFWLLMPTLCTLTSSVVFSNAFDNNMSIKKIVDNYTKVKLRWMMKAQVVWILTLLTIAVIGCYLIGDGSAAGTTSLSNFSITITDLLIGFNLMYYSIYFSLISCIEEGFEHISNITVDSSIKYWKISVSFIVFYGGLSLLLQGIWMVMVVPAFYIGMAYTLRYIINQPPRKREKVVVLETCTDV